MRDTLTTAIRVQCDYRDRGTARGSNVDFLVYPRKKERERERGDKREKSFPDSFRCGAFPDAALRRREAIGRLK